MSHDGAPSDGSVLKLSVGRANPNGYVVKDAGHA